MSDLTLDTPRLHLRPPAPRDMAAGVAFYLSDRARYSGGLVPRHQAFRNMAAMLGHWQVRGYGLWAVTRKGDDTIIGLVGPYSPDGWPEREVGWLMFDGAEGHGFAAEAARAAIDDARTRLGWGDVVHYIAHANARSIALAERLGAVHDPDAETPDTTHPVRVYRNTHEGP